MFKGKKGYDGVFYFIMLLIGLILGVVAALWLVKSGIIDPSILPF